MSVVGRVIQPGPTSYPQQQFAPQAAFPPPQWGAPCPPWQCGWNGAPWYPQMSAQAPAWAPAMPPPPPQYPGMHHQFVAAESESEDDVEVVGTRGGFLVPDAPQDYRYMESVQTLSGAESVDEGLSSAQSVSTARSRSSSRGGSSRRGRASSLPRTDDDECEGIPVCQTRSHSSPPCRDYL
eukprot:Hpha_TRINITY_DN11620_c1_g1::TRINITY_DN11620_c1_g1_i1::g.49037::m.49037